MTGGRQSLGLALLLLYATAPPSLAQNSAAPRAGISSVTVPSYAAATKDDWEEINFEYDHAVLTDGFPSLLRLAELLNKNSSYKVRLEGHGDQIGTDAYNLHLGQRRADAVKEFLLKYGARDSQIESTSRGKRDPKINDISPAARFMNRRVQVFLTDKDGKLVSAGGVGDAIKAIDDQLKRLQTMGEQCCNDILKRLDKLDDILNALNNLRKENAGLKNELDNLKKDHDKIADAITRVPAGARGEPGSPATPATPAVPGTPGARSEQGPAGGAGPVPPTSLTPSQNPDPDRKHSTGTGAGSRFQFLGANAGADNEGRLTFTGRARYFAPFHEHFAVQAQGEYMYFRDRQEGQFDLGLVTRFRKNLQAGVFSSFRTVNLREHDNNGTLGQASFTLDWLLRRGKVGLFGSKGFLDEAVISRRKISPSFTLETFLKTVDQVGASGTWQLWKNNFVEGNFGYLHGRGVASRPGGTLRFVFPVNDLVALTLEGGMNETLLGRGQNGRVVGGVLFGNFMQPRQFLDAGGPVPVDIPRVRYEVLTRRVRTGFAAPVADAGPDQIGVAAGTIQLDGSGSYHPDGLPLAYQWTQIAGNSVAISGVNSVRATFRGEEGQSYAFRLTVRDPDGAVGIARTVVTTRAEPDVRIVQFVANPAIIRPGQSASLAWQVDNAEEVSLQGIGRVDAKAGTVSVSPAETTTYRLTARNRKGEINSTVTVSVERQVARVLNFSASPMTITAGETSTLSWSTENAETVEISGLGRVAIAGNQQVSPTQTTTYTITVRNRSGDTAATVTVQVVPRPMPRILRFLAAPPEIFSGETSTLIWSVENADEVSITSVGIVESSGTNAVAPTQNTTYTLTARNAAGEVRATASVNVFGPPRILSFTGNPLTIKVGETATLAWATADATSVSLTGAGAVEPSGSVPVKPTQTTTYTLTATGRRGNQVSQQVIINVTTDPAPPGGGGPVGTRPPVANAGPDQTTTQRTITLDGSRSFHPDGKLIRFSWRVLNLKGVQEFRGTDTARPTVIFAEYAAYGEYVFELTVTDQDGRFSTSTTRVTYYAY